MTFAFAPDRYAPPSRASIATGTLSSHLAAVAAGARERFAWPWAGEDAATREMDPTRWLRANTRADVFALDVSPSLAQCVAWEDRVLVARYLFDHEHALAHPETLDPVHLALAHGTIAAKLFDDGAVVLTDEGVRASLRWRATDARGTRLCADGSKQRTGSGPREFRRLNREGRR